MNKTNQIILGFVALVVFCVLVVLVIWLGLTKRDLQRDLREMKEDVETRDAHWEQELQNGADECRNILTSMAEDCKVVEAANKRIEKLYREESKATDKLRKMDLNGFMKELKLVIEESKKDDKGTDSSKRPPMDESRIW